MRRFGAPLAWLSLWFALSAQDVPRPAFQSTEESNLYAKLQDERNPYRRLEILKQWTASFPNSAFRQERFNETIKTYRALNDGRSMLRTATEMAAADPLGQGNYWIALLTISLHDASPAALERGRQAAQSVLQNAPESFAEAKRARSVSKEEWQQERSRQEMLAHRTLGWIALQQRDYANARMEFTKVLDQTPDDAEVCYWLGTAFLASPDRDFAQMGLHEIAKALSIKGPRALLPDAAAKVRTYFDAVYRQKNGSGQGEQALLRNTRPTAANNGMKQ